MINASFSLLDHMNALAEGARCRLLLLLEDQELTVSDLCAVLQLPQSTVSRHLKTLQERGWVHARRDGTHRLYEATVNRLDPSARQLWELTRAEAQTMPSARLDRERLQSVLAQHRSRSREFFDEAGEHWDELRDSLFGRDFYLNALLGLVSPDACVADLGCGTGTVAAALAPFVSRVIGVDGSNPMLDRARRQLARFGNVELRAGELESLPIAKDEVDIATLMLVLHHLERPEAAIREAARCLRPGGRILVVDMVPHDRTQYRQEMGHVWLGFSQEEMNDLMAGAGFGEFRFRRLAPAIEAKGPNLFVVTANLKE